MKLYRQVSTDERMPENDGWYFTDNAKVEFIKEKGYFTYNGIKSHAWWWLEEIEIPTPDEINDESENQGVEECSEWFVGFYSGAEYILNKIKS